MDHTITIKQLNQIEDAMDLKYTLAHIEMESNAYDPDVAFIEELSEHAYHLERELGI